MNPPVNPMAAAAQAAMMNGAPATPQQVQIPMDTPCTWLLHIGEAAGILDVLDQAPLPHRQWGALLMRLQSMTQQAAQDAVTPQLKQQPPQPVEMFEPYGYAEAKEDLARAEALRRTGDGTLITTPSADPSEDYAAALTVIGSAMHHLEEALPNGQGARVHSALSALEWGAKALSGWLTGR